MLDTEEKQILDQANKDEDLHELRAEKDIDGYLGPIEQKFIDTFYAVTSSMEKALRQMPDLHFSEELESSESYALDSLYMAKTGRSIDSGEYISGLERNRLLNQALIYLQPVLAFGLRTDFREGREIYDKLVSQVDEVNADIKSAILKEAIPPRRRTGAGKTEEEDTDGEDDAGDTSDGSDDDAAGEQQDEQIEGESAPMSTDEEREETGRKGSIWSRLIGKKPSADDTGA